MEKNNSSVNSNNFVITGFVKKVEVKDFKNCKKVSFGISKGRKVTDKDGKEHNVYATVWMERFVKDGDEKFLDNIKEDSYVTAKGFFSPDEYEKDGKKQHVMRFVVSSVEPAAKEKEA